MSREPETLVIPGINGHTYIFRVCDFTLMARAAVVNDVFLLSKARSIGMLAADSALCWINEVIPMSSPLG